MQWLIDDDVFRKRMIDLSQINPTSKMSLKMTCLSACNNDVRQAQELYDFIAGGIELPDLDPIRPSIIGQVRQGAGEVFEWVQSHKDDLMHGYQMIQALRTRATSVADVPPIPKA